jgi:hypothetical protein
MHPLGSARASGKGVTAVYSQAFSKACRTAGAFFFKITVRDDIEWQELLGQPYSLSAYE